MNGPKDMLKLSFDGNVHQLIVAQVLHFLSSVHFRKCWGSRFGEQKMVELNVLLVKTTP